MRLLFLGTRGEIEKKTRRHRRHSALLVGKGNTRIMIDCGADWLGQITNLNTDAILLTHAHRDHAYGLSGGAPCRPLPRTAAFCWQESVTSAWRLMIDFAASTALIHIKRRSAM
jgi:ribonuclease BN (tRNA processing enzyme)